MYELLDELAVILITIWCCKS